MRMASADAIQAFTMDGSSVVRRTWAHAIAQTKDSRVASGMPKEVLKPGGAERVTSQAIPGIIAT